MDIQQLVNNHLDSLPESKRSEMVKLHHLILKALPGAKLWFDNGLNAEGKVVTNATIGYGLQTIKYANGDVKDYFQIGISANKSGISVYVLGLADKAYLAQKYSDTIGKAMITGYCIKFKRIEDINLDTLITAIKDGAALTGTNQAA